MLNVGVEHVGVTSGAVTPHSHDHEMAASPFVSARDKTLLLTLTPPPDLLTSCDAHAAHLAHRLGHWVVQRSHLRDTHHAPATIESLI